MLLDVVNHLKMQSWEAAKWEKALDCLDICKELCM